MVDAELSSSCRLGQRFCRLPRELRDFIWFYIVQDTTPFDISSPDIPIPPNNSALSSEYLEAVYTHQTCRVTLTNPDLIDGGHQLGANIWGPYPQHKRFVRHLVVSARESSVFFGNNVEESEYACTEEEPGLRREWLQLLELPRLESLKIEMQKTNNFDFGWMSFSPILYELREQKPDLRIRFFVCFDEMLKKRWDEYGSAEAEHASPEAAEYSPMGFADVSELIDPPSEKDRGVVRLLRAAGNATFSLDIKSGLLDETPESRRRLASTYTAKEPEYMRVLAAEHYEIYKRIRDEKLNGIAESVIDSTPVNE
jgi:hypothetical protein